VTVVGIIPARAGSKRLPGKNLAPLAGRPLIAHTCAAAQASGVLTATYVNTEDPGIAAAAQAYRVSCPVLRPAELASDTATTRSAVVFMLDWLAARGETYDALLILQPTSPLRSAEDIRAAWRLFCEHAPCAVVSVSPVTPRSWLGTVGPDGAFDRWTGDDAIHRLNGAIYIYPMAEYRADRPPPRTVAYVMPPTRGVDIDRPEDLALAEVLLQRGLTNSEYGN